MSAKQQIPDFMEADVKEEGGSDPDVENKLESSEVHPQQLPAMMSADVPALTSDEIVNFLISDEIEIFPAERKTPEVTLDPLEQGISPDQAAQGVSIQGHLEIPQVQAASDAGPVENKQTETDRSENCPGVVTAVIVDLFDKERQQQHSGKSQRTVHPKKRKWQSSEDPQDPLNEKKVAKTAATNPSKEPEVVEKVNECEWEGLTTVANQAIASTDCRVSIDNSWVNPIRLSKEVQRILKNRLEEVQQIAKERGEKLETALCKVKEGEEANAGLKQKNERLVEELEEAKETHMKDLQELSKQVSTSVRVSA